MTTDEQRIKRYERIHRQLEELLTKTNNKIARMTTIAALLHHKFSYFFWTGFYLLDKGELIVVTEKGFGKRSKLVDWPLQRRGGYGVKAAEIAARIGKLVAAQVIGNRDKNLIVTSKLGQVIKLPIKDITVLTRQTQGVILIRLSDKKDVVAAASSVKRSSSK